MFKVHRAVYSLWPAGRMMGPNRMSYDTLGFVSDGEALYEIDDAEPVPTHRGDVIWLPRGTWRRMQPTEDGVHLHSIQLEGFHSGELIPEVGQIPLHRPAVVQVVNPSHVEVLFKAVERLWVQASPYSTLETRGLVMQIFAQLLRAREATDRPPHVELQCERVIEYLTEHFTRPDLRLEDVAAAVGWSKGHLTTTFRRVTGESPMAYVRRLRINLSLDLLATGNLTVTEVAHTVGFNDPAYFSRVFCRHMGQPPSVYVGVHSPGGAAAASTSTQS